ncbi:MAG: pentapeptide repeat-containing protein, partial [Terriglobales bacterium]
MQEKVSKAMGARAKLANAEDLAIIQQGAKAWNEWRGKNKERASFNLSGADLQGRDLTGADLRGVDLSNANLRGADLQDVNFSDADLFQANLRESNLHGADLSKARGGLLSRQLAGSDLTGAQLSEPLTQLYNSLSSVKEISDSAQKLFLALLGSCLYSWLTIAQTTDVELITNRATTP